MGEPRVLLYDIENAPSLAWVWQTHDIDRVVDVEAEWYMLSFAWKWQGDKRIQVLGLDDFPGYERDPENDRRLVKELWKLFDEADITIAHNGDRFDCRKANARFIFHHLGPPSPYKTIDTLKIARQHFMFNSNKLDDLGRYLGVGRKAATGGWRTWRGCMTGDPKAWATLKKYNKQDVEVLEGVYLELRPFTTTHPNIALIAGRPEACPKCGAPGPLQARGKRDFGVTTKRQWWCNACRSYSYSRLADKDTLKPEYVN